MNDAKRIIDNTGYAGVGIDIVTEALNDTLTKFSNNYTIDANGNYVLDTDLTIAQVSPSILELYNSVNDALIKMDELSKQQ